MRHLTLGLVVMAIAFSACGQAQSILRSHPSVNPALISMPVVQKDLGMTNEQKGKVEAFHKELAKHHIEVAGGSVEEIQEQLREYSAKFDRAVWDELAKLLDANQLDRFRQINRQDQGVRALASNEAKEKLSLTADQEKKLQALAEELNAAEDEVIESSSHADGGENFKMAPEDEKKLKAIAKKFFEKGLSLLSDEQRKLWEEMLGPKLEL